MLVIQTMAYSEKVPFVVGSKIIDWAMGMMTKGELMRATATWKQAHFGAVTSGSLQLPCTDSKEDRSGEGVTPSQFSDPTASRGSAWMMVGDLSVPLRRLPSLHFGLLVNLVTLVCGDTACRSTCLLNWHKAPSCLSPWYKLPPMGSCTWGPLEYQFAWETWVPNP